MNILITGSQGFIAKNLIIRLSELKCYNILTVDKKSSQQDFYKKLAKADIIFHLAGINKEDKSGFNYDNNYIFAKKICSFLESNNKKTKIIFASSIQAKLKNSYGKSKLKAENIFLNYNRKTGGEVLIYRLPNIFGKWAKPFYNSAVATFCYQVHRNKKIIITEPKKKIPLIYIDDLVSIFLKDIRLKRKKTLFVKIKKIFYITVFDLVNLIKSFNQKEKVYLPNNISNSLVKNLYSTYISYFSKKDFKYELKKISDKRGYFCEFLKNIDFGQISFLSILPKKIRGNHYHNTKTEKFVVISGNARFNFINVITKERFSILVDEKKNMAINTIPGWAHNIENVGTKTVKVLVWSNEIFDKKNPDTIFYKV